MIITENNRIPLAFGLNIAAGLSTCIGAIIIFSRRLVHLANPSSLGIALGLSAGVMIFISLVEIYKETVEDFEQGLGRNETNKHNPNGTHICDDKCKGNSSLLATACFITGAAIIFLIDFIVHKISPDADHALNIEELNDLRQSLAQPDANHEPDSAEAATEHAKKKDLNNMALKRALNRTGVLTALAIGIHNLPEGIATYMGAIEDPKLGVVLAISIALHNIPEGIAVAVPIYFATKSKLKAILWTFLSALAEPLGGVICYLIIGRGINKIANGVMFGLVVGMMVTISIKELIPTAYRFCPSGHKVTFSMLAGMCIMALSLILMAYAGV